VNVPVPLVPRHLDEALVFAALSDDELIARLRVLVGSHRKVMSDIVAHLAEVGARRLHVRLGFDSLFRYCVETLGFSEDEAYRRTIAARMAREFPVILQMLTAGSISLSVVGLLRHRLTPDNCPELLEGVAGLTVRGAKEWLAARFPVADVPENVRKLPSRPLSAERGLNPSVASPDSTLTTQINNQSRTEPLSATRYAVKLTISKEAHDKLELARDLVRHRHPNGKLESVIEMALDALLEKIARSKLGEAKRPRPAKRTASRHFGRAARREAVARDGLQCAHVAPDGKRCTSRCFLEFDHIEPAGLGGGSEGPNARILCKAHNRLAAEERFGAAYVAAAIKAARQRSFGRQPR
jgi:hypothetical protein